MITRRETLRLAGAAGLAFSMPRIAAAQTQPAIPKGYSESYGAIIEASKKEPELLFYSNGARGQMDEVFKIFQARYPWVKIGYLESDSFGIIERYLNEAATGTSTGSLILTSAPSAWLDMIKRGEVVEYVSPETSSYPDLAKSPSKGLYDLGGDPLVFVYNKLLLPQNLRPKGFTQLVELVKNNPSVFNGKITATGAHISGAQFEFHYYLAKMHGDRIWSDYAVIGPQTRFERSGTTMVEKLLTGEYVLAYLLSSRNVFLAFKDQATRNLLEIGYMQDGTALGTRGFAITRGGKSPNTARMMLDFLLSHEGQVAYGRGGPFPARADVTKEEVGNTNVLSELYKQVSKDKIMLMDGDPEMTKNYDSFLKRWKEVNKVS